MVLQLLRAAGTTVIIRASRFERLSIYGCLRELLPDLKHQECGVWPRPITDLYGTRAYHDCIMHSRPVQGPLCGAPGLPTRPPSPTNRCSKKLRRLEDLRRAARCCSLTLSNRTTHSLTCEQYLANFGNVAPGFEIIAPSPFQMFGAFDEGCLALVKDRQLHSKPLVKQE